MSEKSRDAEHEDLVQGGTDAAESPVEPDEETLSDSDIDDPDALEAAESAVAADDDALAMIPPAVSPDADDETIAELEEGFTPEEREAAAAPIVRKTSKAPVRKKETRTRRRSEATPEHEDHYKARNPAEFTAQSVAELKRVVWPTWPETASMFSAVLIFVLIMIAIVGLLDFAFGWGLLRLLGSN